MNLGQILSVVAGLLGLAGVAGMTWAVLRSNLLRTTVSLLKDRADALEATLEDVKAEAVTCKQDYAELKGRYDTLTSLVTGTSAVEELGKVITKQHAELLGKIDRLERRQARRSA